MKIFFKKISKYFYNSPDWLKAILCGLLLGVSIIFLYVGIVALLAVYICLKILFEAKTAKRVLTLGFLVWLAKGMVVLSFLVSVYPITGFSIENIWHQIGLIFLSWLFGALALSFGGAIFGGLLFLAKNFVVKKTILVVVVPLFWLTGELASSLIYSIVTLGNGSFVQFYFSMGYIGYAAVSIPGFLGWAIVGGVYGLTMLLLLLVAVWYFLRNEYSKKYIYGSVISLIFFGFIISSASLVATNTPTVLTIDTFFSSQSTAVEEVQKKRVSVLTEAVAEAQRFMPDYILLPEDSQYLDSVYHSSDRSRAYALYRFLNSTSSASIIDTAQTKINSIDAAVVRSLIFSSIETPVMSDKKYLTPQGEYLPHLTKKIIQFSGNMDMVNNSTRPQFLSGVLNSPDIYTGPLVLFCFESVNPLAVRTLLQNQISKPSFIAHPVSHAWFHSGLSVTHQLDTMLRVQSVWNQITIISAGNQAVGKTYLPDGTYMINKEIARGDGWVIRESQW